MHKALIFFLGILYTTVFCFVLKRINNKANNQTKIILNWLLLAFITKVFAGIAYGYLYAHYFPVSDSWSYFKESLINSYNLKHQPLTYFSVAVNWSDITNIFSNANNGFWNNAGENILIKLLAILNIFSGENYYVSSILYNIFSFIGLYLLYKVAAKRFINNKFSIFILIFFLPSNLFWSSGIDKEGLVTLFSGTLIYQVDVLTLTDKFKVKNIAITFLSFCGVLLMRSATALIFVPAIVAWFLASKINKKSYVVYIVTYTCFALLFFLSPFFGSKFNMPLKLAEKQHLFLQLQANSRLPLTTLQPTFTSYASVLPQAINHIFLRPYINEILSPFHFLTFLENLFIIIIITAIFFRKPNSQNNANAFSFFLFSISLTGYLLIGFTVPFVGAITRYKALYTVFLMIPFIDIINFDVFKLNFKLRYK